MFRHTGKNRTLTHNLKLAALLSFVAGIVNVSGLFAVHELTTNVTGHFAYFANNMVQRSYSSALVYLVYILSFFIGAVVSSFLSELMLKKNGRLVYIFPVMLEISILTTIAFLSRAVIVQHSTIIACSLLFAMGLQNALVTSISNSVVRTTHLTGLFTDLGIEITQLFFYKEEDQHKKLTASIRLRLAIISFFFLGCVIGGYTYFIWGIFNLLLAVICLITGLLYDALQYHIVAFQRKRL
jgi:uncharacterized membrane protein YoaK (UPF0700 family)